MNNPKLKFFKIEKKMEIFLEFMVFLGMSRVKNTLIKSNCGIINSYIYMFTSFINHVNIENVFYICTMSFLIYQAYG
jgi:hypothetical protein